MGEAYNWVVSICLKTSSSKYRGKLSKRKSPIYRGSWRWRYRKDWHARTSKRNISRAIRVFCTIQVQSKKRHWFWKWFSRCRQAGAKHRRWQRLRALFLCSSFQLSRWSNVKGRDSACDACKRPVKCRSAKIRPRRKSGLTSWTLTIAWFSRITTATLAAQNGSNFARTNSVRMRKTVTKKGCYAALTVTVHTPVLLGAAPQDDTTRSCSITVSRRNTQYRFVAAHALVSSALWWTETCPFKPTKECPRCLSIRAKAARLPSRGCNLAPVMIPTRLDRWPFLARATQNRDPSLTVESSTPSISSRVNPTVGIRWEGDPESAANKSTSFEGTLHHIHTMRATPTYYSYCHA